MILKSMIWGRKAIMSCKTSMKKHPWFIKGFPWLSGGLFVINVVDCLSEGIDKCISSETDWKI